MCDCPEPVCTAWRERGCTCVRERDVGPVRAPDPDCPAYLIHVLTDRQRECP